MMSQTHFERHEHPLLRRNYRVATTAIESFVDLVARCLRVLMPGALVYARPRVGMRSNDQLQSSAKSSYGRCASVLRQEEVTSWRCSATRLSVNREIPTN